MRRALLAGGNGEPRHRCDGRQSLAPKAKRGDVEEIAVRQFGRRMALDSRSRSSGLMPAPSSTTRISRRPPPSSMISIRVAPASSAFSTSSLTADAGRSTTSPAAMRSTRTGSSLRTAIPPPSWNRLKPDGLADDGDQQLAFAVEPLGRPCRIFERHGFNKPVATLHIVDSQVVDLNSYELSGDFRRSVEVQRIRAGDVFLRLVEFLSRRASAASERICSSIIDINSATRSFLVEVPPKCRAEWSNGARCDQTE